MNLTGSHELIQTAASAWSLLSPSAQPHMVHFFSTHQPSKHLLCYAGPLFFHFHTGGHLSNRGLKVGAYQIRQRTA